MKNAALLADVVGDKDETVERRQVKSD